MKKKVAIMAVVPPYINVSINEWGGKCAFANSYYSYILGWGYREIFYLEVEIFPTITVSFIEKNCLHHRRQECYKV